MTDIQRSWIPSAIIVDLDGTLALLNGRNPYDASTCENDALCPVVSEIIRNYVAANGDRCVILMSGRMDEHREPTTRWLEKHSILWDHLHMRATGDGREDSVVKRELFDNHVRGAYNIDYVLDDRSTVVSMWRSLGLKTLQVADGNF